MVPKARVSWRRVHGLAGGRVECLIPIKECVQREECLGTGGVEFGEVDQRGSAQLQLRSAAVFPAALSTAPAVPVQLHRTDECDVAHLAREGNAVVREA